MELIINSLPEIDKVYTDHIQALNDPKLRQEDQDLCFDLHLPCPSAYWTLGASINGKLIETIKQPAGSWTRSFWNWMAMSQLSINSNSPHLAASSGISFAGTAISDTSDRFLTAGFEDGMEIIITNTHFNNSFNVIAAVWEDVIQTVFGLQAELAGAATIDRYFGNDDTLNWKTTAGVIKGSVTELLKIYPTGTGGSSYTPSYATQGYYGFRAGVTSAYGILVGTDNTAFATHNYQLYSLISHGTGLGQLSYQGMANCTWTYSSLTMNTRWTRYFNNNSGGDITAEEVGLVANTEEGYILFERHVTGGLLIPATAQLQYDYNMSLTYPS